MVEMIDAEKHAARVKELVAKGVEPSLAAVEATLEQEPAGDLTSPDRPADDPQE